MKMVRAGLLLVLGLAACSDGGDSASAIQLPNNPAPVELCLTADCHEKTVLMEMPSAENLLFSDDGRLFVSANGGVFEITRDNAGAFAATRISADGCTGGLGLAIARNHLYAICSGGLLYGGELTAQPALTELFALEGMCIANGMAEGPDGHLYVVDEPLSSVNCVPDPKIVRLNVGHSIRCRSPARRPGSRAAPLGLLAFGLDNVLRFPNGLQRIGNTLLRHRRRQRLRREPSPTAAPAK